MSKDKNLMELLDIYADLIDQQAEMIRKLTELTRRQEIDIQQYKAIAGCEDLEPLAEERNE